MEITVGLLYRGTVRRYLQEAEFYGQIESWKEIKGFLESKFLIRKPSAGVIRYVKAWAEAAA